MQPHLILGLVKGEDLCPRVRRRQFRCEVRRLSAGRRTHVQHVRAARDTLAVADQSVPTSDRRQILRGFTLELSVAARLSTFRLTAPIWSQPAPAMAYTANIVPLLRSGLDG